MKVKDLIDQLSKQDPEAEIRFAYTASDYWRSYVTESVDMVRRKMVKWSEYHQMWEVCKSDASVDDYEPNKAKNVVIIESD